MDFRDYGVEKLAKHIKDGTLSAREVTEAALANIERLNVLLNAFCAINPEDALKQADSIDALISRGDDPGPLAGVPLGVKDMEDAKAAPAAAAAAAAVAPPPEPAAAPPVLPEGIEENLFLDEDLDDLPSDED